MDKTVQVVVMYALTHLGLIFFMYPSDVIEALESGHWIAVMTGYLIHLAVIAAYMYGLEAFKGQNLIQICLNSGKLIAAALLLPTAAYLTIAAITTVRAYSEIITLVFLSNTPLWSIMLLLVAIAGYLASLGLEAIFRTGAMLAILFIPPLLFIVCTSFKNVDWHYLLPVADRESATLSFVAKRPFLESLFAFAGGFLFLGFVQPALAYKGKRVLQASMLLVPMFLLSVYVPLLTFGRQTASRFQFPYIMAVDTIEMRWIMFERINLFFLLSVVTFVTLFLSLLIWKISRIISLNKLDGKLSGFRVPAVALLSGAIFVICLQIPDWERVSELMWWNTYLRLYIIVVIPAAVLALGIRRRRKVGLHGVQR